MLSPPRSPPPIGPVPAPDWPELRPDWPEICPSLRIAGRCAAIEILVNTPHIAHLIRDGRVDEVSEAMQQSSEAGMRTFDQALLDLYVEERITMAEALVNADSAANLEARIHFG